MALIPLTKEEIKQLEDEFKNFSETEIQLFTYYLNNNLFDRDDKGEIIAPDKLKRLMYIFQIIMANKN